MSAIAKIGYSQETSYGNYDLAERLLSVTYSKEEKCKMIRDSKEDQDKNLACVCCYDSGEEDPQIQKKIEANQ